MVHVVSHESTAPYWHLDAREVPAPRVTVPRNHSARVGGAVVRRADLAPHEVRLVDGVRVTSPLRTVLDLARSSPFEWGLAAADSALRLHLLSPAALQGAAAASRGPGAPQLRKVAAHADGRAGSCLESLLRALLIGHDLGPLALQVALFRDGHAYDLAVPDARILIEADGARFHRDDRRAALDSEDVTIAAAEDHVVLRFTWWHVTRRPAWVVSVVRRTTERQRRRLALIRAARLRADARSRR